MASGDRGPLELDHRQSVALEEPGPTISAGSDVIEEVPFNGTGVLAVVGQTAGCDGDPGLITTVVEIEMRATHMGRSFFVRIARKSGQECPGSIPRDRTPNVGTL